MEQGESKKALTPVSQQLQKLQKVIVAFDKGQDVIPSSKEGRDELIQLLADFECWDIYVPVVKMMIQKSDGEAARGYYQNLAKVYFNYLDQSTDEVSQLLTEAVHSLDLSFNFFWRFMILEAMYHKNYTVEAHVIEYIVVHYDRSRSQKFLEKALERLILIYEEKLHIEDKIFKLYKILREVNHKNHKALIYFKNMYMQSQQWNEVEQCLKYLMESSQEIGEESFYRIELATVYLHYLDEVDLALKVLDGVDVSAGFSACQVKFSLLLMMGEYERALAALQPLKQLANTNYQKATIYYHSAVCHLNLGSKDLAFKNFETSLKRDFNVYVFKNYVKLCLNSQNRKALLFGLKTLEKQKIDEHLIAKSKEIRMKHLPEAYVKSLSPLA
ncbi:MAG: hypothetical protein OXC44_07725 [Proteobacteria bacterium]|nr:hypothetical protein [Pseudomonadota bacterium]